MRSIPKANQLNDNEQKGSVSSLRGRFDDLQASSVILRRLLREIGIRTAEQKSQEPGNNAPPMPELPKIDFAPLADKIGAALRAHQDVGQINPRPAGLHNAALQLIKKVLRRSLSWFIRPLHLFQISVVHSLQHLLAALQNHDDALQNTISALAGQQMLLQQFANDCHLVVTTVGAQQGRVQKNENDLQELTATVSAEEVRLQKNESDFQQLAGTTNEMKISLESLQEEAVRLKKQSTDGQEALTDELNTLRREFREFTAQSRLRDRDPRRLHHIVGVSSTSPWIVPPQRPAESYSTSSPSLSSGSDFDYAGFEDLFRGDEAAIRTRQAQYLEFFRGRANVVDLGCGRGEFLELLRDHNIPASGVELNRDQFLLCLEKGLAVVQQDLFTFLEAAPDASLGGIFSAQVIEHFNANDQLRYVELAHKKVAPGSPVIFETINAQCIYAVVHNFFLDPTHIRLIHPETLKFAMESTGFRNVELRFSSPAIQLHIPPLTCEGSQEHLAKFNQAMAGLNDLLYGYQDYAAVGWR
jgi:O-antigen chain-terminating methyltransferase